MEPDQSGNKFKISWLTWLMDLDIATYKALDYASQIAYSSKEVLRFTYSQAVKYRNSPGVYVECGVAAGAQIIAMAAGAPNKTIYAFDSFEGIPFPSNKDDQMPGIRHLAEWEIKVLPEPGHALLESTGATSVSLRDFEANIYKSKIQDPERIIAVKGWFEDMMPKVGDFMHFRGMEGINILRIDCDLYYSTYICLKYLYCRTLTGSLVIIDDWKLPGCQLAVKDYMKEIGETPNYQVIEGIDSQMCYWIV